jgi:glycosyltransferase involved in cell wall biosynthesis
MSKLPITLIVLTKDEELNLDHCLKSAAERVGQIVVVDSGSSDKTIAIAKKYGSETYEHPFRNQAEQFNWALDNIEIKEEWILRLDADEVMSEELWREIEEAITKAPEDVSGFYLKRRVYFMGRWIKHGGYYPTWILRLFCKGKARSEERAMDEHIILSEGRALQLQNDFKDENHKDLKWWKAKHRNYAKREAQAMFEEKYAESHSSLRGGQPERKRWLKNNLYLRLPIFIRPILYFIYRYFLRLGFLDGAKGLVFHFLQGLWYRFLVDMEYFSLLRSKTK